MDIAEILFLGWLFDRQTRKSGPYRPRPCTGCTEIVTYDKRKKDWVHANGEVYVTTLYRGTDIPYRHPALPEGFAADIAADIR